jgi:hypothetical protein
MNEPLTGARERTVESLTSGFANGAIDVDELERRLALVHNAQRYSELQALVTDLVPVNSDTMALVPVQKLRVVMGSIERTGPWAVPQQLRARVFAGNLELDLREARLAPGVTTIEVNITMGNVEVIVPPDYQVDVDASSVLGHVEDATERVTGAPTQIIRVVGRVKLGNLEVSTLRRGETRREAKWRRRDERRWRHRAAVARYRGGCR